jgi:hypothetical protein
MDPDEIDKQLEEAQKRLQTGISFEKADQQEPTDEQMLAFMRQNPEKVKSAIGVIPEDESSKELNKAISEMEDTANALSTEAKVAEADGTLVEGTGFIKVFTKALTETMKAVNAISQEQGVQQDNMRQLAGYVSDIGTLIVSGATLHKAEQPGDSADGPPEKKGKTFEKATGKEVEVPTSDTNNLASAINEKGMPSLVAFLNKADEHGKVDPYRQRLYEDLQESGYQLRPLRDDQRQYLQSQFIEGGVS